MATQTIDLGGTTDTIPGDVNGQTLAVIGQHSTVGTPGTLQITGTVDGSSVDVFFNDLTIGGMENGSTLSMRAGTLDIIGTASGGEINITNGVGIVGGNVNGVAVNLDTSQFINLGVGVTANGDVFDYISGTSTVELAASGNGNVFENLNTGDHIELGTPFDSMSLSPDQHTITLFENSTEVTTLGVTFAPGAPTNFFLGIDKNTGLSFIQVIPCFAAGTRIMTARGEVAVEELREGDLVVTLSGKGSPLKRVRWIGERRLAIAEHPRPELVRPVRIRAGAFAEGMPLRDLVVSPDHAIAVDGVLMNAGKLVNGVSIVQDLAASAVHYFHVELDQHDVLLADGMPAESYLDTGNRGQFSNSARLVVLHPDFSPKQMQTDACLPFAEDGPVLAAVRQRLIERLQAGGHTVSHEPNLTLVADGRVIRPSVVAGQVYHFALPANVTDARLVSRSGVPSGTSVGEADSRRLGVCVGSLALRRADGETTPLALDDPALKGFHAAESNGKVSWRWTDGEAILPAGLLAAAAATALEVTLRWPGAYWVAPEATEPVSLRA